MATPLSADEKTVLRERWDGKHEADFDDGVRDVNRALDTVDHLEAELERAREPAPDYVSMPPTASFDVTVTYVYRGPGKPLPYPFAEEG